MPAHAWITLLGWLTLAAEGTLSPDSPAKLPPEKKRELIWLILFVLAAGVTLIVVVMLLMRVWRRNIARLQRERRQLTAAMPPDIWKAGGDRLIARMSPFPKAERAESDDLFDDGEPRENDDDPPFPPPPPPPENDDDDLAPPRRKPPR